MDRFPFEEIADLDFWIPTLVVILCGGMIGLERQLRGKPIGIRTSILICLATRTFVHLGASIDPSIADPTRVLGQVVTGIGFLGAGTILARGEMITGVTSAAVVWILAAIGSLIGMGRLAEAVVITLISVGTLAGVRSLESAFKKLRGGPDEPYAP